MKDKYKHELNIGDYVILYDFIYGMIFEFTKKPNTAHVKTKTGVFYGYPEDIKKLLPIE